LDLILGLGIFALLGGPLAQADWTTIDFMDCLDIFWIFLLLGLLLDSSLNVGRCTLRTWKAAVHFCGLKNPLAFYLEILVARPRVVMRLRTELGSHFMIFSYGLPWDASLYERVACEEA
jgi:hypothetical protein